MSAATVHLISKNYDIVYSIDTDDDADFIRDVMARCLQAPSAPNAEPLPTVSVPVDRSNQTLTDGSAVPADRSHTQDRGDGQQKGYVVLSADERAKGFVRPVRQRYVHTRCGVETHMGLALAETYARDPEFYSGTFCVGCKGHFPLDEFVWSDTDERVGS